MYPNLIKDNFGVLTSSYLVIRRNIEGLPLKGDLQEHFNVQISGFFMEFSKLLPVKAFPCVFVYMKRGSLKEKS